MSFKGKNKHLTLPLARNQQSRKIRSRNTGTACFSQLTPDHFQRHPGSIVDCSLCLASSAKETKTVITHKSKSTGAQWQFVHTISSCFLLVTLFAAVVSSKQLIRAGTEPNVDSHPESITREKTSITVITSCIIHFCHAWILLQHIVQIDLSV